MTEAYPLRWPDGWPRTPSHKRQSGNQFGRMVQRDGQSWRRRTKLSPGAAQGGLIDELRRLGAKSVVISSNVPLRLDGLMRADAADRHYDDPGVAVYFSLNHRPMVMAQDAYAGVAENMRRLTLAIEAMRALERHGGGTMMNRAFDGFSALPPPSGAKPRREWWEVLRYARRPDLDMIQDVDIDARYRAAAKKAHPDAGGSDEAMAELNAARDEAMAAIREGTQA